MNTKETHFLETNLWPKRTTNLFTSTHFIYVSHPRTFLLCLIIICLNIAFNIAWLKSVRVFLHYIRTSFSQLSFVQSYAFNLCLKSYILYFDLSINHDFFFNGFQLLNTIHWEIVTFFVQKIVYLTKETNEYYTIHTWFTIHTYYKV